MPVTADVTNERPLTCGSSVESGQPNNRLRPNVAQDPSRHPVPKWPTLGVHCKDLAGYYTKAAKEAEQMASMHDEMAKPGRQ